MRSYEAARTLFSFMGFIAWSVIVIGVLVALAGAGGGSRFGGAAAGLLAMVPGISIAISGFILLVFVQIGRAGVDTAEYTQQMLKISRDQLEVSKQVLKISEHEPKSFASVNPQPEPKIGFEKADFAHPSKSENEQIEPETTQATALPMLDGYKLEHKGRTITHKNGMFLVGSQSFSSLSRAQNYVEKSFDLRADRKG